MTNTYIPEPVTHFTDRAAAVTSRFSVFGLAPSAAPDMRAADEAVTLKLQDLDAKVAGPTEDDLVDAGTAYGAGKGSSKVVTMMGQPDVLGTERYATIRAAAQRELVRKSDKPEFTTSALIAEVAGHVGPYLQDLTDDAAESLANLPAYATDHLTGGRRRATTVMDLADLRRTPSEEIDALRAASTVWGTLHTWAGSASGRAGLDAAFRAIASGSTSPHNEQSLAAGHTGVWSIFLDAPGMAAMAAGYTPEQIILGGHGKFAPLSDPLGDDGDTYRHRVSAASALDGLLEGKEDVMAGAMRQVNPSLSSAGALRQSRRNHSTLQRVGLSSPSAALEFYLSERPDFRADVTADSAA